MGISLPVIKTPHLLGEGGDPLDALAASVDHYWLLDETGASNRADSGINAENLPLAAINTVTRVTGPSGLGWGVLLAGGANNYMRSVDADASSVSYTGSFTVWGWVLHRSLQESQSVFSHKVSGGAGDWDVSWYAPSGYYWISAVGFTPTFVLSTSAPVRENTWHLIAAGYDADNAELWISVNGGAADTQAVSGSLTPGTTRVWIGNNAANQINGMIAPPGMVGRKLTDAELAALYNDGNGALLPVAGISSYGLWVSSPRPYQTLAEPVGDRMVRLNDHLWKAQDAAGGTVDDGGNNAEDLSLTALSGAVSRSDGPTNAPIMMDCDPTDPDYWRTTDTAATSVEYTTTFSIWVWLRFDAVANAIIISNKVEGGVGSWQLIYTAGAFRFDVIGLTPTNVIATTIGAASQDTNYLICAGYDSDLGILWISANAGGMDTVSVTGTPTASGSTRIWIGWAAGASKLNGGVGQCGTIPYRLTQDHIDYLYNSGAGVALPTSTSGVIPITSSARGGSVEAQFNAGGYADVISPSGSLTGLAAASGDLVARLKGNTDYTQTITPVSIGETFNQVSSAVLIAAGEEPNDHVGRTVLTDIGSGVWALVYREAASHEPESGSLLHIRFSEDQGVTWTAEDTWTDAGAVTGFPIAAHGAPSSDNVADHILITAPNGDLLLLVLEAEDGAVSTYQYRSTDGGDIWADEGVFNADTTLWVAEDWKVIGTDIYVTARYDVGSNKTHPHVPQLFKSTDNGATWAKVTDIGAMTDCNEPGLGYLGGNNIVVTLRGVESWQTVQQIKSTDLGATWGTLTDIGQQVWQLHRPRIRAIGSRQFLMGRHYDHGTEYPVIYYSDDSAETWIGRFFLGAGPYTDCGYVDMLPRDNGDLYCVFYAGTTGTASIYEAVLRLS